MSIGRLVVFGNRASAREWAVQILNQPHLKTVNGFFCNHTGAAGRLKVLDKSLSDLKEDQKALSLQWETEKKEMESLQNVKEEIERVNLEIQQAERDYDLNRYYPL